MCIVLNFAAKLVLQTAKTWQLRRMQKIFIFFKKIAILPSSPATFVFSSGSISYIIISCYMRFPISYIIMVNTLDCKFIYAVRASQCLAFIDTMAPHVIYHCSFTFIAFFFAIYDCHNWSIVIISIFVYNAILVTAVFKNKDKCWFKVICCTGCIGATFLSLDNTYIMHLMIEQMIKIIGLPSLDSYNYSCLILARIQYFRIWID